MGAVYAGRSLSLDRPVAVKVIHPDHARHASFVLRFEREARALAKLSHPNIVTCFQVGQALGGERYLLMELVAGQDLYCWVRDHGVLEIRDALGIVRQIADALAYAQEEGLIHRDVKPENILLETGTGRTRHGAFRFRAKLVDLGLAVPRAGTTGDLRITEVGTVLGSPLTMAPEQAESPESVDHRSDIYALGATLYYSLLGEFPHEGVTSGQILSRKLTATPDDPRLKRQDLSEDASQLILRMLRRSASERHQTYDELIAELDALIQATAPTGTSRVSPPARRPLRPRLRWLVPIAFTILALGLGIVAERRLRAGEADARASLPVPTMPAPASMPPLGIASSSRSEGALTQPTIVPVRPVEADSAEPSPDPPALTWTAPRRILGGPGQLFEGWERRPGSSSWQAAEETGVCDGIAEGADGAARLELKSLPAPPWRWQGALFPRSSHEVGVHLGFDAQEIDVAVQELSGGTWFLRISRSDGARREPLALLTLADRRGSRRELVLVHSRSSLWARLDGGPSTEGATWARIHTPGAARRASLYVKKGAASFDAGEPRDCTLTYEGIMRLSQGSKAPDFEARDWNGKTIRLSAVPGKRWLAFFRYASCPLCNLRVHQIVGKHEELTRGSLSVVAVFQSPSESIARNVGKQAPPFPIIADPDERLYALYGLETSLGGYLSPRNFGRLAHALALGFPPRTARR